MITPVVFGGLSAFAVVIGFLVNQLERDPAGPDGAGPFSLRHWLPSDEKARMRCVLAALVVLALADYVATRLLDPSLGDRRLSLISTVVTLASYYVGIGCSVAVTSFRDRRSALNATGMARRTEP